MTVLNAEFQIEAKTRQDLLDFLEEATRKVRAGYPSGYERSSEGSCSFRILGQEEASGEPG